MVLPLCWKCSVLIAVLGLFVRRKDVHFANETAWSLFHRDKLSFMDRYLLADVTCRKNKTQVVRIHTSCVQLDVTFQYDQLSSYFSQIFFTCDFT